MVPNATAVKVSPDENTPHRFTFPTHGSRGMGRTATGSWRRRTGKRMINGGNSRKPAKRAPRTIVMRCLGLGFLVQGFRCFPWMGVNFFLKDTLGLDPSTLQILQNSANIPMVGKPLYGVVSDTLYISGGHRLPYVGIGALLQAVSWLSIVLLPKPYISVSSIAAFLVLGNLGASITEVANDAIVAEAGKQSQHSAHLQSFVWTFASFAGIIGNLLGGIAVSKLSPTTMFLLFGLLLTLQFFLIISVPESSLNLPKKNTPSDSLSISKQLCKLRSALSSPEISYSIGWFASSFAFIPILLGTMFYYQTQQLKLESSIIGLSKVLGQVYVLVWSLAYNKWLKEVPSKKLLTMLQGTISMLMVSDVLFVRGFYSSIGIPDALYVVVFSGFIEVLVLQFKVLPFSVHIAQLCPVGCEGSLMAFVMSAIALSTIVSAYFGVALANAFGLSGDNFSRFQVALLVEAGCAALPLFWSSWISGNRRLEHAQIKIK